MSERERFRARERPDTTTMILAAETLKEYTVLSNQQCPRRTGKEAHPKAVLSTKQKQDDPAAMKTCSSPHDCTTPVNTASRTLTAQVVASPRCQVSRQRSTPVDPDTQETHTALMQRRPDTLGFRRDNSNSSEGSEATTPCPVPSPGGRRPSSGATRHLGSSYPPGPARLQQCYESSHEAMQQCDGCSSTTTLDNQLLARKIAERLIVIGDGVTIDADVVTVEEVLETFVTTANHNQGVGLTWRTIGKLYWALSRLLATSVQSDVALEGNEAWQTFNKLWKRVLQSVSVWIAENGGWFAFIRATDDTTSSCMSSTPNCTRRRFTCSHPPSNSSDATRYSTPQVPRRGFSQNQSSPAICMRSARGERGSRVLSLTQEGMFHLEETCEDSEQEQQSSPDEGIQFVMPTGSQSSFSSIEGVSSPPEATPPQPRPQSSTTLREATPTTEEVTVFDRNRSMSFPRRRRRPSSAGTDQRHRVRSEMDDREMMCESLDSGLAASSETSIASTDSGMHYSALGVSAVCVFEAVKSILDHK